jgi:hypothetical protein
MLSVTRTRVSPHVASAFCGETAREADIFRLASNPVIELDPAGNAALGGVERRRRGAGKSNAPRIGAKRHCRRCERARRARSPLVRARGSSPRREM